MLKKGTIGVFLAAVMVVSSSGWAGVTFYNTFDSMQSNPTQLTDLTADFGLGNTTPTSTWGNINSINIGPGAPGFGTAIIPNNVSVQYERANNLSATQGTMEMWWKPSDAALAPTTGYAWECSYFFASRDTAGRDAFNGSATGAMYLYYRPSDDQLVLFVTDANGSGQLAGSISAAGIVADDWYHLALTYTATTTQLFFNGIGSDTLNFSVPFAGMESTMSVGGGFQGGAAQGSLDAVAFYDNIKYSGSTYTVPTTQIPEPVSVLSFVLGGIFLIRRRLVS